MDRIAESLFVGTIEDASTESLLAKHSINRVISLTHTPPEGGYPNSVTVTRIPLIDGPRNDRAQFEEAVEALASTLRADETVLVHCSRGASRSPSVAAVAVALVGETGGIEAAFDQVASNRAVCDPHDALVRQAVAVYQELQSERD